MKLSIALLASVLALAAATSLPDVSKSAAAASENATDHDIFPEDRGGGAAGHSSGKGTGRVSLRDESALLGFVTLLLEAGMLMGDI